MGGAFQAPSISPADNFRSPRSAWMVLWVKSHGVHRNQVNDDSQGAFWQEASELARDTTHSKPPVKAQTESLTGLNRLTRACGIPGSVRSSRNSPSTWTPCPWWCSPAQAAAGPWRRQRGGCSAGPRAEACWARGDQLARSKGWQRWRAVGSEAWKRPWGRPVREH